MSITPARPEQSLGFGESLRKKIKDLWYGVQPVKPLISFGDDERATNSSGEINHKELIRFRSEIDAPINSPINSLVWGSPIFEEPEKLLESDILPSGEVVESNRNNNNSRKTLKFGDFVEVTEEKVAEMRDGAMGVLARDLKRLLGRMETKEVESLDIESELYQVWGESVDSRETCTYACIQMLFNHAGWVTNGSKSGFDFVAHKLEIVDRAIRVNPRLISRESGGFVLSPAYASEYVRLFHDLYSELEGGWAEANSNGNDLQVFGGIEWAKDYLSQQGLLDELEGNIQIDNFQNPYLTGLAIVHRIVDSFVHGWDEAFSVSQTSRQDIHDNSHQVVISGMRKSSESKFGIEFRVIDPLDKNYVVRWVAPEMFIGTGLFFVAKNNREN